MMTEFQPSQQTQNNEGINKFIDGLAETAFQTDIRDNLSVLINNLKIYCSLLIEKNVDQQTVFELKKLLRGQIKNIWEDRPIEDFRLLLQNFQNNIEGYPLYKHLTNFQNTCRLLISTKKKAQNTETARQAQSIIDNLFARISKIINDEQNAIDILNAQDFIDSQLENNSSVELKQNQPQKFIPHFEREFIDTNINLGPEAFGWVKPDLHKLYVSEVSRCYNEIVPFKIKSIVPHSTETPNISIKNYFVEGIDEAKAILAYCIPGTNKVGFYPMVDIINLISIQREYYQERTLSNDWIFSKYTKSVVTPQGKIYAINCRTTDQKIDPYIYEITDVKASNKGPLPNPKRQSSLIYLNGSLYVIGGSGQGEKCSNRNYRFNLKDKKWSEISNSNVPLKKPTLCILNGRYLLKTGGLNQFEYINKVMEIYDPLTDKWSLVRANAKSVTEEIQFLEDSLAVQINEDQVYIFGGKNPNKYSSDRGFILQINEIKQKKRGASKVLGELWNVSVGKRNLLSFYGAYSPCNVLVHFNCIYFLRVKFDQALSI